MPSVAMREILAQAYAAEAQYISLHSGPPGDTGANEITTVARRPLTWTPGSADGVVNSGMVTFTVPAGTILTHVGIWSASVGGQFIDSMLVDMAFELEGSYSVSLTYTQN